MRLIKPLLLSFFVMTVGAVCAQSPVSALIPMPEKVELRDAGYFAVFKPQSTFVASPGLEFETRVMLEIMNKRMGVSLSRATSSGRADIKLTLTAESANGDQGYRIESSKAGVEITAATPAGIYYGLMTLDQILLGDVVSTSQRRVASLKVYDSPRFEHRALMIDPARHFYPVEDVMFFIDQMARYKFNKLQIHLTDDQGWRVEIKKHPLLTSVGAFRDQAAGNQPPHNGFYTQDELRQIVRYASDRHIEVIPEIDMPGHSVALLAAYPELGCSNMDTIPRIIGTTTNMMLCCRNDKVYEIVDDVIEELAQIFPSDKIHLGGDEAAVEFNWAKCDQCLALMREKGYDKPSDLMNVFFGKVCRSVEKVGKTPMLWCELDNIRMPAQEFLFDYPKNAILITWRNGLTPKCIELTERSSHKLIMAPGEYAYFDYPQFRGDLPEFNNWGMPILTLQRAYEFDPGYGLSTAKQAHIMGVSGTMWSEAIQDINRLNYMTYPRALALAEAGWSQMSVRDWNSFKVRIYPNIMDLMQRGVSVRAPFEIGRSGK